MSLPPVPPRPYSQASVFTAPPPPPPLPPHPPEFEGNRPHIGTPIPAPRPQRLDPNLPANMARTLDDQIYQQQHMQRQPSGINYTPGFAVPAQRGPSPIPPPQQDSWTPWNPNPNPGYAASPQLSYPGPSSPYPGGGGPPVDDLNRRMGNMAFSPPPQVNSRILTPAQQIVQQNQPQKQPQIPTVPALSSALQTIQNPSHDPALKVVWCRDVLYLVNHSQPPNDQAGAGPQPVVIKDQQLLRLAQVAVPMILSLASQHQPNNSAPVPLWLSEAIYHRATLESSGSFPEHIKHNPRHAFRDFEVSARAGFHRAWFRLGRDYENFGDNTHAKDCFERGANAPPGSGGEPSLYRLGIAHLLGQLGFPPSPEKGLPLIHRAALQSSLDTPEPGYVYALLLLGEFSSLTTPLPRNIFSQLNLLPVSHTHGNTTALIAHETRKHLETSANLGFPPAQYKMGHCFEFAAPQESFPFDPLQSVEWYSKASKAGELEADLALSKWFLCGAEGFFDKDESLAWTFAERAAKNGLASAMFALGYYLEVGIGPNGVDIPHSIEWYRKARDGGNADAEDRLRVLEGEDGTSRVLSREEHEGLTENKLVRKRTLARERSMRQGSLSLPSQEPGQGPGGRRQQIVEGLKRNQLNEVSEEPISYSAPPPSYATPPPAANASQGGMPPGAAPPRGRYPSSTHASSLPPQPLGTPPGGGPPGGGPGGPPSHFRETTANRPGLTAHRYTLTDMPVSRPPPGSGSGEDSPPLPQGGQRRVSPSGGGRLGVPGSGTNSAPTSRPVSAAGGKPTFTTFADMGIQGVKAEDKECVVM